MSVLLVIMNLIIIGLLIRIGTRRDVSLILTIGLLLCYAMWYAIPTLTSIAAWRHIQLRTYVEYDEFLNITVGETAVLLVILAAFAFGRRRWRWVSEGQLGRLRIGSHTLSVLILLAIAVSLVARHLILGIAGWNYLESNAFAVRAEGTAAAGLLGILFVLYLILQSFLYACFITPVRHRPPWIIVLMWGWLLYTTFIEVLVGSRVALLTPCILLLMWLHQKHISRTVLAVAYAGIGFFVATVGVVLTIVIAELRLYSDISVSNAQEESKKLVEQKSGREDQLWQFFDHIQLKFDIFSAGVLLIRHGEGVAGFKPYEGALLSIVPRRIMPSKPVPGSIDGTNRGLPPRIVAVDIGYDPDIGNVGVSPGAIARWQFGWLGLVLLAVVTVLNLRLMNSLLTSPSIPLRTLALYIMSIPTFGGIINSPDFLIINAERMMAVYVLATIGVYLLSLGRRPRKSVSPAAPQPPTSPAPA